MMSVVIGAKSWKRSQASSSIFSQIDSFDPGQSTNDCPVARVVGNENLAAVWRAITVIHHPGTPQYGHGARAREKDRWITTCTDSFVSVCTIHVHKAQEIL